jgi:hypothetical protein
MVELKLMKVPRKYLFVIGAAVLMIGAYVLIGSAAPALANSLNIPGIDPHNIPGIDPHNIPGIDPHNIPGIDPHNIPGIDPHNIPGIDPHAIFG